MQSTLEIERKNYQKMGKKMPISTRMRLSRSWIDKLEEILKDLNGRRLTRKSKLRRKDVTLQNSMQAIKDIYRTSIPYSLFSHGTQTEIPAAWRRQIFEHKIAEPVLVSKAALLKEKNLFNKPSVEGSYSKEIYLVYKQLLRSNRDGYLIPCYQLIRYSDGKVQPEIYYPTDIVAAKYFKAKRLSEIQQEQKQISQESNSSISSDTE